MSLKFIDNSILSISNGLYLSLCPSLPKLDSRVNKFNNNAQYLSVFSWYLPAQVLDLLQACTQAAELCWRQIPTCNIYHVPALLRTLQWLLISFLVKAKSYPCSRTLCNLPHCFHSSLVFSHVTPATLMHSDLIAVSSSCLRTLGFTFIRYFLA